jgi:quercetin dioxygenase-like cupin family protein
MTRLEWPLRSRLSLALAFAALVVMVAAAQQESAPQGQGAARGGGAGRGNFANNFTGTIAVQQTTGMNMSRIRFEAGARTNWHVHTEGQILLIEEGRGRLQELGDPVKELALGQPVLTKPNVLHWHGAAPDSPALQFSVYGGKLDWKQAVTDEEYQGKKR